MSLDLQSVRGGAGRTIRRLMISTSERLRAFAGAREGNIAILFAVMAGVLMLLVGGAVDYTRRNAIRAELIESLDSAGLAMAQLDALNGPEIRDLSDSERETYLKNYGERFFNSNFKHADLVEGLHVDFAITDTTITPSATGSIRAVFLPIGRVVVSGETQVSSNTLSVATDTEVTRAQVGDTEVALVLDTTGSMAGQKITDLKDAAKELVDILVREDQTDYYSKVAIAPFSFAVNADTYADAARGTPTAPKTISGASWNEGAAKTITNATWKGGTDRDITGITRASPAVVTTSVAHGFAVNDVVYIRGVAGSTPPISTGTYTVSAAPSSTTFRLTGVNSNRNYTSSSNDFATKCQTTTCEVVVTSNDHGLATGDVVYITGVNGMTQINGAAFTVRKIDNNQVALSGIVGTSYGTYTNGGTMTKCRNTSCNVFVTATGHGFSTNDRVFLASVLGMTQINSVYGSSATAGTNFWQLTNVDSNTFSLNGSFGPSYGTYTSGGDAYCTTYGCQYYYFTSSGGTNRLWKASNCVSERTGDEAYTDASPSTSKVGFVYLSSSSSCGMQKITPLTASKDDLDTAIDALNATGSTAGQIGLAWGWYLVSPNFNGLFTGDSAPAAYDETDVIKAVVLMTDGEFNYQHCNGVSTGSINCASPNGDSFTQAEQLCIKVKDAGVKLYTVGFQLGGQQAAVDFMNACASDAAHAYQADDGDELKDAFRKIAQDIRRLRISR